ncbi:MAG TPA: hypothetical protein VEF76_06300 [Patescibacteria group bacterium]|nr:hypothetical protein [Patescibacteria group bacterium]
MTRLREPKANPTPKADEVLVEDNRFTPFGALPESNPAGSFTGAPVDSVDKPGKPTPAPR